MERLCQLKCGGILPSPAWAFEFGAGEWFPSSELVLATDPAQAELERATLEVGMGVRTGDGFEMRHRCFNIRSQHVREF